MKTNVDTLTKTENHTFDKNGDCKQCDYHAVCKHKKATFKLDFDEYTSRNDKEHKVTEHYLKYCPACKEWLDKTVSANNKIDVYYEDHNYNTKGVCKECGFVKPVVRDPLSVSVSAKQSEVTVDDTISASCTASGGSGTYQYAWKVACDGSTVYSTDTIYGNSYQYKANKAGKWTFTVADIDKDVLAPTSYESEHPHKKFQKCKVCGYAVYTGQTEKAKSCTQCNSPATPKPATLASVVTAAPSDDKTIKKGESDKEKVKELQGLLCKNGYLLSVDGSFGPNAEGNVKKFQKDYGLEATGIVDTATWRALREHSANDTNKLHENRNDKVDNNGRLAKIDNGKAGINTPHYYYDVGDVGDNPKNTEKIYK